MNSHTTRTTLNVAFHDVRNGFRLSLKLTYYLECVAYEAKV
jgi:hypothetical protein